MPILLSGLRWLWALVAPWLGKPLLKLLPWFAPIAPALKLLRPVLIGLSLGLAVIAVGWWIAPVERLTVQEAKQMCEEANLRAELAAAREALSQAQITLRLRSMTIDRLEQEIATLNAEREALRAAAPDPNAIVFDADDPWLRTGSPREVRRSGSR